MAKRPVRDLTVGAVVALGLLIFAAAVMIVGEESKLFRTKVTYTVIFPETVKGLREGSPVSMAGVQVGSVTDIDLPTEPDAPGIEVTIGIAREYAPRVRENSRAALRWLQILSGEKYIEINTGDPELPAIPAGASIPPLIEREFFEQTTDVTENLNDITLSLKNILVPLERGEGLLGRLIHDPEFGAPVVDSLGRVLADLEVVMADIREGRGFLGRVLMDPEFAVTVDDLATTFRNLSDVTERLAALEADLSDILRAGGPVRVGLEDFAEATASLKRTLQRLESRDNVLGRMLTDDEYADKLSGDLQAVVGNLAEVTDKLKSGEGTLGALIYDRTVYDGLEEVVAGVNDSKFARWLLRRYQKKGIKNQEKEAAAAEGDDPAP
jgi:phospholipid/cholesterol/gamma-HCH transport system substrate-binding protein